VKKFAWVNLLFALLLASVAARICPAQAWIAPSHEELAMTSLPEVPGAPAVYLYKEQTTDDERHTFAFYTRLKVLTEGGKEYANVELPYVSDVTGTSIDNVEGRTIQPDGSIVPFTGKPYQKLIVRGAGFKERAVVFTLPAVQVGSIIEYRYKIHMDAYFFRPPQWEVQGDLFVRKAHYTWKPTGRLLESADGKGTAIIAWTPILPPGVDVKQTFPPKASDMSNEGNALLTLDVANIMPLPREQFMPPMQSMSYRVLFYYTYVRTAEEYWKSEGRAWSRERDKFIGPNNAVTAAVNQIVGAGDTPEQKLHKLYAAVMGFENTDLTRERSTEEEKAAGLKTVKDAGDVIARKRGSGDQLALTFVAMARAAGLKAYAMGVADRSKRIFLPSYLSLDQLDDDVAIVQVDGKDVYFDPGQRYCGYGHLAWRHTLSAGLRQVDGGGAVLAATPSEPYQASQVSRIADLTLDDQGVATGAVTMVFTGDPALTWRHRALRGDDTSIRNELRTELEEKLPGGTEVKVVSIENLTDGEKPLKVTWAIKGPVGSSTGKRLVVPADLFEAATKPRFPEAKRTFEVDMHFGSMYADAIRFKLPPSLVIEAVPPVTRAELPKMAVYNTSNKRDTASVTLFRNLGFAAVFVKPESYADLRTFFSKVESSDQDSLVLTRPDPAAKAEGKGGR
jgi:hypothetical protein